MTEFHIPAEKIQMQFLHAFWLTAGPDDPVELFSEVDAENYEVRSIEIYRDGSVGFADQQGEHGGTRLGEVPLPPFEKIAQDPEFKAQEITQEEFERVWAQKCSKHSGDKPNEN